MKYAVIAKCADGDVLVSPKGGKFFSTEVEAKAAAYDQAELGVRVQVYKAYEDSSDETLVTLERYNGDVCCVYLLNTETHKLKRIG